MACACCLAPELSKGPAAAAVAAAAAASRAAAASFTSTASLSAADMAHNVVESHNCSNRALDMTPSYVG